MSRLISAHIFKKLFMLKYNYSNEVFSEFFSLIDKGFSIKESCVKMNIPMNHGFHLNKKYNLFKLSLRRDKKDLESYTNDLIEPGEQFEELISLKHLSLNKRKKIVSDLELEIINCKDVEKSRRLFTTMKNIYL